MNAIRLLQFIAFLDLFAIGLIVPLMASNSRKYGASHIHIGLLGSVYAAFQLFSGPLIGSLSDLKGRKSILIFTLLICSVIYTLTGLCTSIIGIIFLRALLGIFKQTQMLTRAMVAEFEKNMSKQSQTYGEMAAIAGVGITFGPIVGGHVVEEHPEKGFTYLSVAVGVCFVINAGIVYKYLSPPLLRTHTRRKHHTRDECECDEGCTCEFSQIVSESNKVPKTNYLQYIELTIKDSVLQLLHINWSLYWDVFLLKGLIGFAMGVYYSNYSLYLKSVYQLSPKYIGYVISFQGTVTALTSYFMGHINSLYKYDEDFTLRNMHVFMLVSISLLGLILSCNVYWYLICLLPLAIGNAVGRLVTLELILKRSAGAHRGSLIGASNSIRSLAGIIAPMIAGFISQYIGVTYCIYASLLSTTLGLCLSCYCRLRSSKIKVH